MALLAVARLTTSCKRPAATRRRPSSAFTTTALSFFSNTSTTIRRSSAAAAAATENTTSDAAILLPHKRCNLMFGANTDVGKTIISAGLCRAALDRHDATSRNNSNKNNNASTSVHYIKPMQCGGSDQAWVEDHVVNNKLLRRSSSSSSSPSSSSKSNSTTTLFQAHTLFRWETATSPHAASRLENDPLSDEELMSRVQSTLSSIQNDAHDTCSSSTCYIETAGGVMSPSSSSPLNQSLRHARGGYYADDDSNKSSASSWGWIPQADLYQPLASQAPAVLVGDGRLGGISATLSSLESLLLRGYDVAAIILLETTAGFDNVAALREYVTRPLPLRSGTGEPLLLSSMPRQSIVSLPPIPTDINIPLDDWYRSKRVVETFARLDDFLQQSWQGQVDDLRSSLQQSKADNKVLWCPKPQPQQQDDKDNDDTTRIAFFDGASGNKLYMIDEKSSNDTSGTSSSLSRRTISDDDDCQQGNLIAIGHGESSLTLAMAAALGRYGGAGSVAAVRDGNSSKMTIHAPAIALSQKLLLSSAGPGHGWAHRVMFRNDNNGDESTTCLEAAIELGIETFQRRMTKLNNNNSNEQDVDYDEIDWVVCGQWNGSAHECNQQELDDDHGNDNEHSSDHGLFLETPTIGYQNGGPLSIDFPEGADPAEGTTMTEFDSMDQVMDVEARLVSSRKLFSQYKELIEMQWLVYEHSHSFQSKIATIVLEPVVLMNRSTETLQLVDPLWQRALMDIAKSRNVPVVWNETNVAVVAGLCQGMGVSSSRDIMKSNPDIACYTVQTLSAGSGFFAPMTATLVSKEVFESVLCNDEVLLDEDQSNYSIPHPVRCVNALYALEAREAMMATLINTDEDEDKDGHRKTYDEQQIRELSNLPLVEKSFALGTLCAVTLMRPEESFDDGGSQKYEDENEHEASSVSMATVILRSLRKQGIAARSLGNTVYIMASPTSIEQECERILGALHQTIESYGHAA